MGTQINFESALTLNSAWQARYEALCEPCDLLASDVMSGPWYITSDPETGEPCELDGETVQVCAWGEDGITGDFFTSAMASKIRDAVSAFVDDLPRYYLPDCDCWSDTEPECELDPDTTDDEEPQYFEPEPYYEVTRADWYGFFFSPRTARDIMDGR